MRRLTWFAVTGKYFSLRWSKAEEAISHSEKVMDTAQITLDRLGKLSHNRTNYLDHRLAPTEESRLANPAREAGAQTATPAQLKRVEVPSRAARVNGVFF